MIFRKGGLLSVKEKCVFGNQRLEVVNLYKYLGFIFSTKLSFDVATNGEHLTRARRGAFEVIKTLRKLGCSSPSLFFKLFDAQIVPCLLYGSELCGIKARESIEKVHIQACKLFLNVPPPPPSRYGVRRIGKIPTVYSGCSSLSAILVPTTTTAFVSLFQKSIRYVKWSTRNKYQNKNLGLPC